MKRHPIWIILFTILIDTLGIGILGPILPQLLGNPDSPNYLLGAGANVRSGYIMFGFLVAVYPVMQFFATPVLLQFDETNRHMRHFKMQFFKGIANIARAYAMPELRTIFLTSFFFNAGFGFFIAFFGLFLISRFHFNEARIGNFFAWVGVCAIFTQIVTTRRVAARFKEPQVLRISLLGVSMVMFAYLFAP